MLWKCCKNIVDVALFFFYNSSLDFGNHYFFSSHFRQWHCHKFFPPYFGNGIATNQLQQFFFLPISAMPLPQIHSIIFLVFYFFIKMICAHNFYNIFTINFKWQVVIVGLKKFPSYFGNAIATFHFFFFKKWYVHTIFTIFL